VTSLRQPIVMTVIRIAIVCGVSTLGIACADPIVESQFADREAKTFKREVYPVLLRDCGFPECHGAPERFFRVWGPGRTRLPVAVTDDLGMPVLDENGMPLLELPGPFDVPTADEQAGSKNFALSMIDQRGLADSLLLRKPLAVAAGGAGHRGVDAYGRDVYRTTQDSGYVTLARWVLGDQVGESSEVTP